jgi:hypothetical protein
MLFHCEVHYYRVKWCKTIVSNLKPICINCNSSMCTINMKSLYDLDIFTFMYFNFIKIITL